MDAELYSRIREVRAVDCAQALQDVMYLDVLFNFHSAGVRPRHRCQQPPSPSDVFLSVYGECV